MKETQYKPTGMQDDRERNKTSRWRKEAFPSRTQFLAWAERSLPKRDLKTRSPALSCYIA